MNTKALDWKSFSALFSEPESSQEFHELHRCYDVYLNHIRLINYHWDWIVTSVNENFDNISESVANDMIDTLEKRVDPLLVGINRTFKKDLLGKYYNEFQAYIAKEFRLSTKWKSKNGKLKPIMDRQKTKIARPTPIVEKVVVDSVQDFIDKVNRWAKEYE